MAEGGWNGSALRILATMAVGHAVIFAFGLAWLSALMPLAKAWAVGAAPFLLATLLKTGLATALLQAAWSAARRR